MAVRREGGGDAGRVGDGGGRGGGGGCWVVDVDGMVGCSGFSRFMVGDLASVVVVVGGLDECWSMGVMGGSWKRKILPSRALVSWVSRNVDFETSRSNSLPLGAVIGSRGIACEREPKVMLIL